jgi:hypothetical protein
MLGSMEHAGRSRARLPAGVAACVAAAAAVLAATAAGCGDVPLGDVPGLVFWAGAETGDTTEWTAGNPPGGASFVQGQGQIEVVNAPVRRGAHAFRAIINGPGGTLTQAALFRNGPFPAEAWYSAWFRLAEAHTTSYWAILKIQVLQNPTDTSALNLWDLALSSDESGTLTAFLSDHRTSTTVATSSAPVPVGRWFHVEMFLRAAADSSGRIEVWQDGRQVMTLDQYATAPAGTILFGVGNVATMIVPNLATIDIDDAAVSTARLGP